MRHVSALLIALIATSACNDSPPTKTSPRQSKATIPAEVFTTERPADAEDLLKVKNAATSGDSVVFLARVGGQVKTFLDGQAVFVVADPGLVSCELMGAEDHCDVPWDYCCEDFEDRRAGMATVRILGPDGRPVKATAMGAGKLDHSKFVVIDGVVSDMNDGGMFVVDARQIWVGGKPNRADHTAGSR